MCVAMLIMQQFKGALVVSPITTPRHQVVGTVNVDSLDPYVDNPTVNYDFETHEINFYQVNANSLIH